MSRGSWSYGEMSPLTVAGHGGFTDVAHDLSRRAPHRSVSRQAVYSWWLHRLGNGCPDRHTVESGGVVRLLFNLEEMRRWYAARVGEPYEEPEEVRDDELHLEVPRNPVDGHEV